MSPFQVIAVSALGVFILLTLSSWRHHRIATGAALGWIALWTVAAAAILSPGATSVVARRVHIARGADLVFYTYIIVSSAALFLLILRIRKLESALTTLVRELALLSGRSQDSSRAHPHDSTVRSAAE